MDPLDNSLPVEGQAPAADSATVSSGIFKSNGVHTVTPSQRQGWPRDRAATSGKQLVKQKAEESGIKSKKTLVLPDPGDSLFVPGAKEHYYMEDAYELNLNSMDSSTVDSENIQTCLKRKSNDEVTILEPNEKVTFIPPEIDELDSSTVEATSDGCA
ncbi:hypothetical protein H4Q26_014908 [Puccinia striiformis f. sp. tritici PST-130]|nr:hypothetical protein H4Q26_014908 [Puccinia striiformis f. sp. tritici PST-130]